MAQLKKRFNCGREWPFEEVIAHTGKGWRRRWDWDRADNDDVFLTWLVHKLRTTAGRNLADGERFNPLAFSVSTANLEVLEDHISAGLYLQFSPREGATLKDTELGVDMASIIIREKK